MILEDNQLKILELQLRGLDQCECVKCYLRVSAVHLILLEHLSADHTAMVHNDVEVRPGSELSFPVSDGRERGDDEERPLDPCAIDLFQKSDGLDGLSQTHLIRQNTVTPANQAVLEHLFEIFAL